VIREMELSMTNCGVGVFMTVDMYARLDGQIARLHRLEPVTKKEI